MLSIFIEPESGTSNPCIHLIKTDFPVPEPPITTRDSPLYKSKSTPHKTCFLPKLLCKFLILILMSLLIYNSFILKRTFQ